MATTAPNVHTRTPTLQVISNCVCVCVLIYILNPILGEVLSFPSLSLFTACLTIQFSIGPFCQSLGYQPVTVATRLAGRLFETRSHEVTWPPILHVIGRCVLALSVHMLLVGKGAPTNCLPSHFHTLTSPLLHLSVPSTSSCLALAQQTPALYSTA